MAKHFLAKVFARSAVPTTAGRFFATHPAAPSGVPAEGGAATIAFDAGTTVFVYVAGGRPPVAGDVLVCHEAPPDRGPAGDAPASAHYFAEPLKTAGTGTGIAACDCPNVPAGAAATSGQLTTLSMTSSNHTANSGMFQDDTFTYQVWPTGYAGVAGYAAGGWAFLSDGTHSDVFHNTFRYYLYCRANQIFLTRVYLTSIFGSPFEDTVRYTWTVGTYGNSCDPFALTAGRIYAGGDASSVVTITG
jgi:hypothetical protein